jgi:pimeloyl-ACP methyl ester carboxylesterase
MCNPSVRSAVSNVAKTYCSIIPSKKNAFVQRVLATVLRYLRAGKTVHLMGHSYGGSVAARIAEIFSAANAPHPNLVISTFGSVYIPQPARTAGVRVRHFMYVNDVALRCNALDPKQHRREWGVTWVEPSTDAPAKKASKLALFGTRAEWSIHNSYAPVMRAAIFGTYVPTL